MGTRRALRSVAYAGLIGALIAVPAGVVLAQQGAEPTAPALGAPAAADVPVDSGAPGSEDLPLLNTALDSGDVVHLTAASRGEARAALADGDVVSLTVTVDGAATEISTSADTVAQALEDAGVTLGWDDEVSVDLTSAPEPGSQITIGRVTTAYITDQVVTPHETQQRETDDLLVGQTRVVQEGVDGDQRVTSLVRLVDGVEQSRSTVLSTVITAAVPEIVEVGTRKPVVAAAPSTGSSSATKTTTATGSANADISGNRALGKELMLAYGFAEDQWSCLEALWTKESQWNHLSKNRSSGAYGIPQALPGSKMASVGADWETNPATQIQWGLGYIAGRYGTPCGAWSAFQSKGWY